MTATVDAEGQVAQVPEPPQLRVAVELISAGTGVGPAAGAMIVYYEGLLQGLCGLDALAELVVLVGPGRLDVSIPAHPKVRIVPCRGLPRSRVGRVLYEQAVLPLLARRAHVDALLSTHNVMPFLWRGPSVVVLSSTQYVHWPEQFGWLRRRYLGRAVPASMARADVVICPTEFARTEAERYLRVPASRSVAVHHGLSDTVRAAFARDSMPRPASVGEAPYVLMASTLYRFKNHHRLVRAFASVVRDRKIEHTLVLAGRDADVTRTELRAVAREAGIADRVRLLGGVPHKEMPALVAHADVVAYTSLYETFGLPVLEGLQAGRPLVVSNRGAVAEVAGDAAVLVDPEAESSIAAGLAGAILDHSLRERLAAAGPARAAQFTWDSCGRGTLAALRTAVERRQVR